MTLNRALFGIFVLAASVFCVLTFGDPQLKWCYIFQVYVYPANFKFNQMPVPKGFSGTWFDYFNTGNVHKSIQCLNGKFHGLTSNFHADGRLFRTQDFLNGMAHGQQRTYHSDGVLRWDVPFVNGELSGYDYIYSDAGILESIHFNKPNSVPVAVFKLADNIDRRADFGIPIK